MELHNSLNIAGGVCNLAGTFILAIALNNVIEIIDLSFKALEFSQDHNLVWINTGKSQYVNLIFNSFMRIFKIHELILFISFIFLVSTPNISFSNKLDRAFKALAENNFPKAKTLFSDELEENPKNFAAIFGLGQYYYLPQNPEMNIDSTYSKWNYCYINFNKAKPDEIELVNQYYKISEKILFQNLHDLCEKAFNSLMSNLSLNGLNKFISKYKIRTTLLEKAIIMRDDSLLKNLKSDVSIDNLSLFILENPSFTRFQI